MKQENWQMNTKLQGIIFLKCLVWFPTLGNFYFNFKKEFTISWTSHDDSTIWKGKNLARTTVFPVETKWPRYSWCLHLTFASVQQGDLEAVPAGLLGVEDHRQPGAGSQKGRFHLLGVTPIHSSAFAAGHRRSRMSKSPTYVHPVVEKEGLDLTRKRVMEIRLWPCGWSKHTWFTGCQDINARFKEKSNNVG